MNREKQTQIEQPTQLTRRGRALLALSGVTLGAGLIGAGIEANDTDFHGTQTVRIDEMTVTDIAKDHVDGAQNNINDTVDKIVEMNPNVFQDGKAFVDSDDVNKEITIPKSVE